MNSFRLYFSTTVLAATTGLCAQTNTFPEAGNVGIGTTNPAAKLDMVYAHGQNFRQMLPASGNGAATGEAGLYTWVSEPNWTWTGAGIARNIFNSGSWGARVNSGLTAQMIRFPESAQIDFSIWGADGTEYAPLRLANNNAYFSGMVGIGTNAPAARLDVAGGDLLVEQYVYARHIEGKNWNDQGIVGDLYLQYVNNNNNIVFNNGKMFLHGATGNVGIGTINPTNKLEVNGTIRTREVIVETTGWSDYVFAPDYQLMPLPEVRAYIATEGRLPGLPSATEVADNGVSVGEMQAKLLAKVEELTLHMIALSEKIDALEAENAALKAAR